MGIISRWGQRAPNLLVTMNTLGWIFIIRLGLNVAVTHINRSYCDSETMENVEIQTRTQREENDRERTGTTKNKHN